MKTILLLPKIQIQNANALSSPYTIGFPAMTAWLGFIHALQRKLNQAGFEDLQFKGVGVACHDLNLQTHKGRGDYVYSIIGTGNPLDKDGSRPAFIEEARCHLTVSLIVEVEGLRKPQHEDFLLMLKQCLYSLKIASGDVLNFSEPNLSKVDEFEPAEIRALMRKLMPSYVLIERRELMVEAMANGENAQNALLDYLTVQHRCIEKDDGTIEWIKKRKTNGWIVPIATGFHGISELGKAENARDMTTPHRFAESVVTLGEFVMPHRIKQLEQLFWHYHADLENNLYLCQQNLHSSN